MCERKHILVLSGPNLNMLGKREPGLYGTETLEDVHALCKKTADMLGLDITFKQSNHEGELVEWIQDALENADGIVINAGAYTHTSVAIHDALKMTCLPFVEVHISNVFARESFRHQSFLSSIAQGTICGLGIKGYALALRYFSEKEEK